MSLDREFAASFVKDSEGFSDEEMKWWLGLSGKERQTKLRQMWPPQPAKEGPSLIRPGGMNWQEAHLVVGRLCGLESQFREVIAAKSDIVERAGAMPLYFPKGLTSNLLAKAHGGIELFNAEGQPTGQPLGFEPYGVTDLDATYQPYKCDRCGPYMLWLKDGQEAECVWKDKSVNWVLANNKDHHGLLLPERLLAGLVYYLVRAQNLDPQYWTDCLCSRGSDGGVPYVRFRVGEVLVSYYRAGRSDSSVRSRSADVS